MTNTKVLSLDILAAILARKEIREAYGNNCSLRVHNYEFLENFHRHLKNSKELENFVKSNPVIDTQ